MLNTFENAERQHLRRLERERHMNILETITSNDGTFQMPLESDEMLPPVDALSGNSIPFAEPQGEVHFSEKQSRFRCLRRNRVAISAVVLVVLAILLSFSLGVDLGEREGEADVNENIENPQRPPTTPPGDDGLERYNNLFSQILDWGFTPRAVLEDVSSAPARALHWLAYGDTLTINSNQSGMSLETTRTRFTLATLYYSTQKIPSVQGDSWTKSSWVDETNWLSAYPVCEWYGVSCLQDEFGDATIGLVQSLNLSSNGLEGSLPNELGLLQLDVRILDLGGNEIGGSIPENLAVLGNLNELVLGPNSFLSTIPESIYYLSHLQHVYVNDCSLTGTISSQIGQLTSIRSLGLHHNFLHGPIPSEIGLMENIQALYLDGNALESIPSTIGHLTNLVDLRLRENQLNGTFPSLENMPGLQILYLDSNKRLSGLLPSSVFNSFRVIRDLQLYDNEFEGKIPSEIGNLIFLGILYIDGNRFTGHVPSEIGQLRNLESLYLFSNNLQGFIPSEVGAMTGLKNLRINNNMLSGPLPNMGTLRKLENLFVNNNTLGGPIGSGLAGLTTISSIHIHGNRFTGSVPSSICAMGLSELTADCSGSNPEVQCDCCTMCFHD